MRFRVQGLAADASAQTLVLDAADATEARRQALAQGMAVVDVRPAGADGGPFARRLARGFDLDLFCQELLALLEGGVTLSEALETLAEKSVHSARDDEAAAVLRDLSRALQEGRSLSGAMADRPAVFPAVLVASMRASERTSDYAPALMRYHRYRRLVADVRGRLVAAATYPLLLLVVSLLVLLFLVGYVVPRFASVYAELGDRMPAGSRAIVWLGQTIGEQPAVAAVLFAALLAAVVAFVRAPLSRRLALRLARAWARLDALLHAAGCAQLYRTLALLVQGGIALPAALAMVQDLLPATMGERLRACRRDIDEGRGFTASMAAHRLATPVAARFFRVGESGGRLGEMIERAADFHEAELVRAADWFGRVIGPALMLVMGVVIGVVVILMYLPIFQLSEAVQ
jgi:general secretion pathway protein F